jgi:hypothetical protein
MRFWFHQVWLLASELRLVLYKANCGAATLAVHFLDQASELTEIRAPLEASRLTWANSGSYTRPVVISDCRGHFPSVNRVSVGHRENNNGETSCDKCPKKGEDPEEREISELRCTPVIARGRHIWKMRSGDAVVWDIARDATAST